MLLSLVLLILAVASAAPLEPRDVRNSIFLKDIPPSSSQRVFLRMDATIQKLAFHNGDKPGVRLLVKARNNHYYWGISDGQTTLVTTDDYGNKFCLDAGSFPADGNLVHVWQCYAGLTQQAWLFNGQYDPVTNGRYGPIKLRDYDLCLDRNNGNPRVAKCSGSSDQMWGVKTWTAE